MGKSTVCGLLLAACCGVSAMALAKHERTIVGAWTTTVTFVNCQTGDPVGVPAFPGLFTFHDGGTMSEYGVPPGSSPALRSPGHGVWQREEGWQDYAFTFMFRRYDATGASIGSQRVEATLKLAANGDSFVTKSAVEILGPNNNVVATGCASTVGTRFD